MVGLPPCCPRCRVGSFVVFLISFRQNAAGDALFECSLMCGYLVVYRVQTGHFEPPPWQSSEGWQPPLIFDSAGLRAATGPTAPIVEPRPAAWSPDHQDPTQPAGSELARDECAETSMEKAGHEQTPEEQKEGQANTGSAERISQQAHGVAPGDASTDPAAAAPQHLPEPRTTGEGLSGSARREEKHRSAHARATQERRKPMKRIMTADEDDGKPEEAPAPPRSNANGDGAGRDGKGAGRGKKVTPKQIEANRRNSDKSTGPRTPEGKDHVRLNALTHGLLSQQVLLPDEDATELDELRGRLWEDWQPVGAREELALDLIVRQFWKLRRSGRLEAALLAAQRYAIAVERAEQEAKRYQRPDPAHVNTVLESLNTPRTAITDEPKHQAAVAKAEGTKALRDGEFATFGWAVMRAVGGPDAFSKLSRYETAILRSLDRAFEELRRLQQARRGNADPRPHARVRRSAPRTRPKNRSPRRSRR